MHQRSLSITFLQKDIRHVDLQRISLLHSLYNSVGIFYIDIQTVQIKNKIKDISTISKDCTQASVVNGKVSNHCRNAKQRLNIKPLR